MVRPGFIKIAVDSDDTLWADHEKNITAPALAQRGTLESNMRATRSSVWISLDNVSLQRESGTKFSVEWYAERIVAMKEATLLHRDLISHDSGWYSPGEENGGNFRGFTGIFTRLIPVLLKTGLSRKELNQLFVVNPREAFTIRK